MPPLRRSPRLRMCACPRGGSAPLVHRRAPRGAVPRHRQPLRLQVAGQRQGAQGADPRLHLRPLGGQRSSSGAEDVQAHVRAWRVARRRHVASYSPTRVHTSRAPAHKRGHRAGAGETSGLCGLTRGGVIRCLLCDTVEVLGRARGRLPEAVATRAACGRTDAGATAVHGGKAGQHVTERAAAGAGLGARGHEKCAPPVRGRRCFAQNCGADRSLLSRREGGGGRKRAPVLASFCWLARGRRAQAVPRSGPPWSPQGWRAAAAVSAALWRLVARER